MFKRSLRYSFSFIALFFAANSYGMECAPAQKKYYTLDELLEQHRTFCKKYGIEDITEEKNDGVNHLATLPAEILAEILGHLIKIPVKEITLSKIWDSLIESESRTRGLAREQISFDYKLEQQKKRFKEDLVLGAKDLKRFLQTSKKYYNNQNLLQTVLKKIEDPLNIKADFFAMLHVNTKTSKSYLIAWIENPENRSWVEEIVKKHANEANRFEKKLKKIEEQEAQRVIVVAYDKSIHKDEYHREFNIHSKFSNHLTMLLEEAKKTV